VFVKEEESGWYPKNWYEGYLRQQEKVQELPVELSRSWCSLQKSSEDSVLNMFVSFYASGWAINLGGNINQMQLSSLSQSFQGIFPLNVAWVTHGFLQFLISTMMKSDGKPFGRNDHYYYRCSLGDFPLHLDRLQR
jgi:hypothetical protein